MSANTVLNLGHNKVNPWLIRLFFNLIISATYEAKERAIKPLGLRIEWHLDEVSSILMSLLHIR